MSQLVTCTMYVYYAMRHALETIEPVLQLLLLRLLLTCAALSAKAGGTLHSPL